MKVFVVLILGLAVPVALGRRGVVDLREVYARNSAVDPSSPVFVQNVRGSPVVPLSPVVVSNGRSPSVVRPLSVVVGNVRGSSVDRPSPVVVPNVRSSSVGRSSPLGAYRCTSDDDCDQLCQTRCSLTVSQCMQGLCYCAPYYDAK